MKKLSTYFLLIMMILNFAACNIMSSDEQSLMSEESTESAVDTVDEKDKSESADEENSDETEQVVQEDNEKASETENAAKTIDNTVNVKSDENSKKVIVIDPGHASHSNLEKEEQSPGSGIMKIKDGGGAQGNTTGTPEYVVNMQVAMKLKSLLEAQNYTVIMTKTSNDVSLGNIERANIGNDNNASLVIRIHCDSAENPAASGASMLVPEKVGYAEAISDVSREYGETVLNSLVESAGMKNRGISIRGDMTGFNWSKVPVILVEMGFMSNPEEDKLLSDEIYQDKLAQGLYNGIVKCFG